VTLKRFEEAIPFLEQCLSFDLDKEVKGDVMAALGLCYLERKDWSTARDHFINAIREGLDSYASSVHFYLGIAYYYCGMLRESKREFLICEQQSPSNDVPLLDVYVWLSSICKLLEQPAESDQYARLSRPS
jgi:tetratricopeptide (TPR) repeat protein